MPLPQQLSIERFVLVPTSGECHLHRDVHTSEPFLHAHGRGGARIGGGGKFNSKMGTRDFILGKEIFWNINMAIIL